MWEVLLFVLILHMGQLQPENEVTCLCSQNEWRRRLEGRAVGPKGHALKCSLSCLVEGTCVPKVRVVGSGEPRYGDPHGEDCEASPSETCGCLLLLAKDWTTYFTYLH